MLKTDKHGYDVFGNQFQEPSEIWGLPNENKGNDEESGKSYIKQITLEEELLDTTQLNCCTRKFSMRIWKKNVKKNKNGQKWMRFLLCV